MNKRRFQMSSTALIALVSLYFALILNYAFYERVLELHPFTGSSADYFLFTLPFFIFFVLNACLQMIALPFLHKIIIPLILLISAAISYNSIFFNIYFNRDMLTNVMQTTISESSRLITLPFVAWILGLGLIPVVFYLLVKVNYRFWLKEILYRITAIFISICAIALIAVFFYKDYASLYRNNKEVSHLIVPSNFISASISKYKRWVRSQIPYEQIDIHAQQNKPDNYRHVTILIVGETTRAKNWGLNGYFRQTTPLLAKRGENIINFQQVESCNTFTAGSVPCMFSHMKRDEFDAAKAEKTDTILDVLQRAGIEVIWLNNNSGCKGVCDRVIFQNITALALPEFCHHGECLDNILLPELDKLLLENDKTGKDTLIVLHTIGSHGPTYYERYTNEFRLFTPTCDTNEINKCSDEALRNTYDNTVVYVDQFIDKVIQRLETRDDLESAVIYMSDHGESLGEKGMYLHSAPRAIAPDEQIKIPFMMWFNHTWWQNEHVDRDCLLENAKTKQYSHDNLYSTLYGMMDMQTENTSYQKSLDIISACKIR